ncbi:leukocyte immunoglobulin-like receptor subfamily A member 6 isoform X4 [Meles meles]|uniref:leukocyte immunoglobulin-like receptor subfamily A member 6 isoform X4 n=1 Tax=Meles meles TaxID=9662 RepID=UPI001E69FEED|nr:leukocyte immunoglobulin-like receptor subfamily A member 6 isoform X4 [Meles meles]
MGGSARTPTLTALLCLGLCRGLWDQAQTGTLPKPSIWADPSPMVTKGSRVTLWCQASLQADDYYLYKDRAFVPSETLETSWDSSNKTSFSIIPMSLQYIGRYQCAYQSGESRSQLSDPLTLVMTGQGDAPSLLANPGPVVALGGNVSLSCSSSWPRGSFHLLKERGADAPQHLEWTSRPERGQGLFHMGPVNTSHAGTYRCYVSHQSYPNWWSQPSDPLHLQVTGIYAKPSLSAQPGASVSWGENVTLQCHSEIWFDTFHLSKEGSLAPPRVLHLQDTAIPYQVNFILSPATSDLEGTYRCYGSHSNSPYLLSQPSDPLELVVSGGSEHAALNPQRGKRGLWWEVVGGRSSAQSYLSPFPRLRREKVLLTGTVPWIANLTAKGEQVASSLCAGQAGAAGTHQGAELAFTGQGLGLRAPVESTTTRLGSHTPRFRPQFCSFPAVGSRTIMSLSGAQDRHRHNRPPTNFRRLAGIFQSPPLPSQTHPLQVHTGPCGGVRPVQTARWVWAWVW